MLDAISSKKNPGYNKGLRNLLRRRRSIDVPKMWVVCGTRLPASVGDVGCGVLWRVVRCGVCMAMWGSTSSLNLCDYNSFAMTCAPGYPVFPFPIWNSIEEWVPIFRSVGSQKIIGTGHGNLKHDEISAHKNNLR